MNAALHEEETIVSNYATVATWAAALAVACLPMVSMFIAN